MFNKSLTIVLPIHNGETRLRTHVHEMLELASELTANFKILIVDDGSTDATFEVAGDLAAHYPQISVRRHRHRSGIGPAIDYVRRNVRSDAVIFHDGVTPVDINQMRSVWRRWIAQSGCAESRSDQPGVQPHDVCDFANLPAIHAAMERAHGQVLGFQLFSPRLADSVGSDVANGSSDSPRTDVAHCSKQADIGQIPQLPRPKFLSALAQFALGE